MGIQTVDIAICTWNRSALLAQTLASVSLLDVPGSLSLSVIVVDNNSSDETSKVVNDFADSTFAKKHRVVCVTEKKQGHTFARNRAIDQSKGELIIWTDDDVLLAKDWVRNYVDAANFQPEASFWGGQIEPIFPANKPDWIENNWEMLSGCFADRDLGDESIELTVDRLPYGANFAVRGDAQRANKFDEQLGRRENEVLGEDELELMRRLLNQGFRGRWVPETNVQHLIPADRSTTKYVYDYFVGQGRKLVIGGEPWHTDVARMRSEARREYRKYSVKRFFASSNQWCSHLVRSGLAFGQWQVLNRG